MQFGGWPADRFATEQIISDSAIQWLLRLQTPFVPVRILPRDSVSSMVPVIFAFPVIYPVPGLEGSQSGSPPGE